MKVYTLSIACTLMSLAPIGFAASSGSAFYGDAPDARHPWAVHDRNRPQPKIVVPGSFSTQDQAGKPPSDAIILFDGKDLSGWESTRNGNPPAQWLVKDGYMQVTSTGGIRSKAKFGDCQLHVEYAAPSVVEGESQGRGNSGIFLMGRVEIQALDSYNNVTYADGHAGSVYGINPPMANAFRPPGEFQVYDIVFRRPIYKDNKVVDPGYLTVFINGVLVQDHTTLEGGTGHMGRSRPGPFPDKGPLELQDHGNPSRFRNIWYRELPPRATDGGTDGLLTEEATMAKRKEIAASIRQDAEKLKNTDNPVPEMLRLMESLVYEKNDATYKKCEEMAVKYVEKLRALSNTEINSFQGVVFNLNNVFNYLAKWKIIPMDFGPKVEVANIIKAQGWDKKKKKQ